MNKIIFTTILIIILIITILILLLFLFLYRIIIHNKRKKIIIQLSKNIKESRIKKFDTVLSRIRIISNANHKFISLYERLSLIFDKMSDNIKILNKSVSKLLFEYKKINNKVFKNKINEINEKIIILNEIELSFNNGALKVTRQDEFTRSEKAFYDKNLRTAINVYKNKRLLLNKISEKIDQLINQISKIHKEFDNALAKANTLEINKKLIIYSKKVIQFCEIINKGPSLQNYIYNKIPKITNDLYDFYQNKKKELKIPLEHINFVNSIKKISSIHLKAKNHFMHLRLYKAEVETRCIIKSVKIVEKMINSEIKSRNIFAKNYEILLNETKLALIEFVRLKVEIKNIKNKKINVSIDFKNSCKEFLELSKIIDSEGLAIKSIINNPIPFSSKLSRIKLFSQKLYEFIIYINKINQYIFELDISGSILKNKFLRAKNAFNQLITQVKVENIKIPVKSIKSIEEIHHSISLVTEKLLDQEIINSNSVYIENVINNIISTYKLIAGPVQISNIIKNLINKLSIDRAINKDLNYQLSIAEREYLEGKYSSSLNDIIQYLEGSS